MRLPVVNHYVLALGYPYEGPFYGVYTREGVTENGFLVFDYVSTDDDKVLSRRVLTATRTGFYLKSEKTQANIKNVHRKPFDDPLLGISMWQWAGSSVIVNPWGWVRFVYFVFAVDVILKLFVLMLVVFRNFPAWETMGRRYLRVHLQ
ncbi:hypothetical protein Poli38472_010761 [Pythium oligandrum]|uniref:Transmembrane protein n=1 Tax=Pythium oligandrum TaxID=41045 RepID=A0A8K1CET0_PYTOL|nr:hypothetical protein Poli38472_010761 [Pythium oligandrum]|eukprot:TMW61698.1 hypothetical protein Poli38472_010761 [Pythium oligandrum]